MTDSLAPPLADAPLAELVGGELVARPLLEGRRLIVAFRSPYELSLSVDGIAVLPRPAPADRRALIYATRRLPALFAALEERLALVLIEQAGARYTAVDLFDREAGCYASHDRLLRSTERLEIPQPTFAFLGCPRHEGELRRLLEQSRGLGERLELSRQEDDRVVCRSLVTPSRAITRS